MNRLNFIAILSFLYLGTHPISVCSQQKKSSKNPPVPYWHLEGSPLIDAGLIDYDRNPGSLTTLIVGKKDFLRPSHRLPIIPDSLPGNFNKEEPLKIDSDYVFIDPTKDIQNIGSIYYRIEVPATKICRIVIDKWVNSLVKGPSVLTFLPARSDVYIKGVAYFAFSHDSYVYGSHDIIYVGHPYPTYTQRPFILLDTIGGITTWDYYQEPTLQKDNRFSVQPDVYFNPSKAIDSSCHSLFDITREPKSDFEFSADIQQLYRARVLDSLTFYRCIRQICDSMDFNNYHTNEAWDEYARRLQGTVYDGSPLTYGKFMHIMRMSGILFIRFQSNLIVSPESIVWGE